MNIALYSFYYSYYYGKWGETMASSIDLKRQVVGMFKELDKQYDKIEGIKLTKSDDETKIVIKHKKRFL